VLIEAIARLAQNPSMNEIELHLAGDGYAMAELQQQVLELGLSNTVQFFGAISDTDSFYKSLDIYVQPSFAEGLPNSVIEAMNAAKPVLASDIGGNQDLVIDGETGYLFPAGNAEELSIRLEDLLNDSAQRLRMGGLGRERIENHFDIALVVDQLIEVYKG